MASYKVPQDVEADDKLIGPFSFRQFIYLMIVAAAIAIAWVFFRILPVLAVIPLPVILFFGALALPLRKDQPMEIYMAAILSFYLKPRQRTWDPDGIETLVQVAAPRTVEPQRVKDVSTDEAIQRLRYLSDLSDTRGWSVRGVHEPTGSSLNTDVFNEAQQTQDVLDENNSIAQNLDHMISQSDQRRHQEMLNRFQTAATTPVAPTPIQPPIADPYASLSQTSQVDPQSTPAPQFNPYPTSMNQTVLQPISEQDQAPQQQPDMQTPPNNTTSEPTSMTTISPDIMKLASNADLSIETIAREAHRISEKEASLDEDEVVISLR